MKDGDKLVNKAKFEILTEWGCGLVIINYTSEQWAIYIELHKN